MMWAMTSALGRAAGAVAVLLSASTLSGCGLLDGSSRLEAALEYLPADTTVVTFVDRARIAERHGASEDDGYGTELGVWDEAMKDAAFDESDVEWEALGTGDGTLARVWKMSDDLDFAKVAADLEDAGYERSGPSSRPTFHADIADADRTGLIGGRYPVQLADLALVPDEELIVTGPQTADVLKVATDDADSLADKGSYDDLLAQADHQDALEYAALGLDVPCTPGGLAVFVPAEQKVRTVRLFDGSAAERDASADGDRMATFLDDWTARHDLDIAFEVTADGPAVRIESPFDARRTVTLAFQRFDGPFACPATPGA